MRRFARSLVACLGLVALWACLALPLRAAEAPPGAEAETIAPLTDADRAYLDGLFKDFLYDPTGAVYARVRLPFHTAWGQDEDAVVRLWFTPGVDGAPGVLHGIDGSTWTAPPIEELQVLNFFAVCDDLLAGKRIVDVLSVPGPDAKDDLGDEPVFGRMDQEALGVPPDNPLVMAAWLYRLGEEKRAAEALHKLDRESALKELREDLAWSAFAGCVHAYIVRDDARALADGERLLGLYEDIFGGDPDEPGQERLLVAELKRRQATGTFAKEPPEAWPEGFAAWPVERRVGYLIDALEEVDARQWGQPGGVDLMRDPRVQALIAIGDPAVPALIDTLEHDDRLTRSVHFWRDFRRGRTVLSVREAALTALMNILQIPAFEAISTGDNFTERGQATIAKTAASLRAYWDKYGGMGFDERMMAILGDADESLDAKENAAISLVAPEERRSFQTTIFGGAFTIEGEAPPAPLVNPVIAKFQAPTTAEAILQVVLDAVEHPGEDPLDDINPTLPGPWTESVMYLIRCLGVLEDRRIAPDMFAAMPPDLPLRLRVEWTQALAELGEMRSLDALAADLSAGRLALHEGAKEIDDDQRQAELNAALWCLVENHDHPSAGNALAALAKADHPMAPQLIALLMNPARDLRVNHMALSHHTVVLAILRGLLDDQTPTGSTYVIERNQLSKEAGNSTLSSSVPSLLANSEERVDRIDALRADEAADVLGSLVIGLPEYHPLLKRRTDLLATYRATLDRVQGHWRLLTDDDLQVLDYVDDYEPPLYLPDIAPLGRAATPADVAAGLALFALDHPGPPPAQALPATGIRRADQAFYEAADKLDKSAAPPPPPPRLLLLQAETAADGSVVYGYVDRHEMGQIPAADLVDVKSVAQFTQDLKEERAARIAAERAAEAQEE